MSRNLPLERAILESGITKQAIASRIGISGSYLSLIIHGNRPGTPVINKRLARVLRSTVGKLGLSRKTKESR